MRFYCFAHSLTFAIKFMSLPFYFPQPLHKTPCVLARSIYFGLFQIGPIADNNKWGKEPIFSKLMKHSPKTLTKNEANMDSGKQQTKCLN